MIGNNSSLSIEVNEFTSNPDLHPAVKERYYVFGNFSKLGNTTRRTLEISDEVSIPGGGNSQQFLAVQISERCSHFYSKRKSSRPDFRKGVHICVFVEN